MISLRSGLAGFVGASKRLIRGVFDVSYSVTSVAPVYPNVAVSVLSRIRSRGAGVLSSMVSDGAGVTSGIVQNTSIVSYIQERESTKESAITETGISVRSTL